MSWKGGDQGGKEEEESKPSLAGVAAAHSPAFGRTPHFWISHVFAQLNHSKRGNYYTDSITFRHHIPTSDLCFFCENRLVW
jgi:hypothetical protein